MSHDTTFGSGNDMNDTIFCLPPVLACPIFFGKAKKKHTSSVAKHRTWQIFSCKAWNMTNLQLQSMEHEEPSVEKHGTWRIFSCKAWNVPWRLLTRGEINNYSFLSLIVSIFTIGYKPSVECAREEGSILGSHSLYTPCTCANKITVSCGLLVGWMCEWVKFGHSFICAFAWVSGGP
jgi:hypothetical protein